MDSILDIKDGIIERIREDIDVKKMILNSRILIEKIHHAINIISERLMNGNKVFFAGNGGSAADAQHLAAEFMGRLYLERSPLPAISLSTNTSNLTAIGNDYSFDDIFSRQLAALGKEGDILFVLSTSGNSKNICNAVQKAKEMNIFSIGFTGSQRCVIDGLVDLQINIPSTNTTRIQEAHMLIGHIICEYIEKAAC